jgi:hypothetical protein
MMLARHLNFVLSLALGKWVYAFDTSGALAPGKDRQPESDEQATPGRAIHCARCDAIVTYSTQTYFYNGEHHHRFSNPHGLVFEIGLYQQAACKAVGEATEQWTWFGGYAWQVALCASCGEHLGWRYTGADKAGFYGLILDRLHIDG